jgi:hypothetical protein
MGEGPSSPKISSICWDREYRLWARCEPCDQHPDGFQIRGTYIRFASAVRIGKRAFGYGCFHVDHCDPNHIYTSEEQSLSHDKPSFNGHGKHHKERTFAGPYLGA